MIKKIDGRLEGHYNTKQLLKLLNKRYGLNQLGIKKLLEINTTRFRKISSGQDEFNSVEREIICMAFQELEGRY